MSLLEGEEEEEEEAEEDGDEGCSRQVRNHDGLAKSVSFCHLPYSGSSPAQNQGIVI